MYAYTSEYSLLTAVQVPALAFTIIGLVGERKLGWGRHIWDVPPRDTATSLKTRYVPHSTGTFARPQDTCIYMYMDIHHTNL